MIRIFQGRLHSNQVLCQYFDQFIEKKINFINIISQSESQYISIQKTLNKNSISQMKQDTPQPITHSLLRNSQDRRKQSQSRPNSEKKFSNNRIEQNILKQKYHFNYSQSLPRNQNKRWSLRHIPNFTPHNHNQNYHIPITRIQKIVVCNSLPHTKPKYSLTFQQPPMRIMTNKTRVSFREQQKQYKTNNIKRDMDYCIYNMSDKLKQLQGKQNEFKIDRGQNSRYRPTLSQLRNDNKLFPEKGIHRIQPDMISKYIQTIYQEYSVPDALEQTNLNNPEDKGNRAYESIGQNQTYQRVYFMSKQSQVSRNGQDQRAGVHMSNHGNYMKADKGGRQNNLISQKQRRKERNGKKRFLNLTLSEQKPLDGRRFQSPIQREDPEQHNEQVKLSGRGKQSVESKSQKKILQLKRDISRSKEHQHNYLSSPYQMLGIKTLSQRKLFQQQYTKRQVNVRVRPFQELMKANLTMDEAGFLNSRRNYQTTMGHNASFTQLVQSKYRRSFFSHTGQVKEEFRFCVLCEQPVLSVNIGKHQQKCIGYIFKDKLCTFKDLYNIQKEEELSQLIKNKITEISTNITSMIDKIKANQRLHKGIDLSRNILQTVQKYMQSYAPTVLHPQNLAELSLFNSNYKKVQSNINNQYILLLQQSNKFHWFVKLLENYEFRLRQLNRCQNKKTNVTSNNILQSTNQRNNNSQTFVQQESMQQQRVTSQFQGQIITQQRQSINEAYDSVVI